MNELNDAASVTAMNPHPSGDWLQQLAHETRRHELSGPFNHVLDLACRLMEAAREARNEELVSDLEKIAAAATAARDGLLAAVEQPEELLEGSQERRSRLRHDLRNRLNIVLGFTEDWLDRATDEGLDDLTEDFRLILRAGRDCLRAIDALLAAPADVSYNEALLIRDVIDSARRASERPAREVGRLLIVDDDPLNRGVLRRRLERIGHQVVEADGPAAAFAAVAAERFDLVLLDVILRTAETDDDRNGFDVLVRLKADPNHRDLPVIMLSALHESELIARGIALGAEDYLSRPIDPVLLQARVDACLEKVRLRQRERTYLDEIDRERRRADELLHVILPERVITTLKETDEIPPRRYEGIAVIFADIVGFTPFCDHRPPEEVISKLAKVVDLWEDAAAETGVQKIKTIGDAFMGAAGLFDDNGEPVECCLRCGLAMIEGTSRLVPEWQLRVGIHLGDVVGGKVGRRQYLFDLWGDTVNTAARMQSHGKPNSVTLSSAAWSRINNNAIGMASEIPVKGKGSQPVVRFERFR